MPNQGEGTTGGKREKRRRRRNQSKGLQNIKNVIYARITLKELAINWPRRRTETLTESDIFLFYA